MKVFKFGGASVNNVERIQQLPGILKLYEGEKKVVVISAMGKTTNALEKVAEAFFNNRQNEALQLFEHIKTLHLNTAKYLLISTYNKTYEKLEQLFTEIEWALHDKPVREYDYYYDQIVCSGELFSTAIISAYLNEKKIPNQWMDVRDIFRTNDNFREAVIEWDVTNNNVQQHIKPALEDCDIVITQGFIGATDENESTTLGREGSDYTAAVFANMLDAESVIIWKDASASFAKPKSDLV